MSYLILIETINYLQLIITSGLIQWNLLTDVKQKKKKKENEKPPKFILNVLFVLYTLIGPN